MRATIPHSATPRVVLSLSRALPSHHLTAYSTPFHAALTIRYTVASLGLINSVEVDACYDKEIREAKALPIAAKRPHFIWVNVDVRYDRGIREINAPPIAVECLCKRRERMRAGDGKQLHNRYSMWQYIEVHKLICSYVRTYMHMHTYMRN